MTRVQIGNSELISKVNSRLVLHAVRISQPTYRAAVARSTGLKPATVTYIVEDLIAQQLLQEGSADVEQPDREQRRTRWGRPPTLLRVNCDVKRILAIDWEPDCIRVALTDLLLRELAYRELRIDRFAKSTAICDLMVTLCRDVLKGVLRRDVLGAGVSLPGLIDRDAGVLISSTNMPNARDVAIARMLRQALRLPVEVERSIHLAALYELSCNPHLQDRTALVISLRTGIGVSLVHSGQLYVGKSGFAGEVGHTVIDLNGEPCECGSRGCLETFVSASAICRRAQEAMQAGRAEGLAARVQSGETLTPELVYHSARQGDAGCSAIVREVGRYLGIAIANLINLLAPHEVVLCGAIDVAGELILRAVREEVARRALARSADGIAIRLAHGREKMALLGAAALVAQQVFELPQLAHGSVRSNLDVPSPVVGVGR